MNLTFCHVETDYLNTCQRTDYATLAYLPGERNAEELYSFLRDSNMQLSTFISFSALQDGGMLLGWDGEYGIESWTSLIAGRTFSEEELRDGQAVVILDEEQYSALGEERFLDICGRKCSVIGCAWINAYTFLSKLGNSSQTLIQPEKDPNAVFRMKTQIVPYKLYCQLGAKSELILISFKGANSILINEYRQRLAGFDPKAEVSCSCGDTEKFHLKDFLSLMPLGLLVCLGVWLGLIYLISFWDEKLCSVRRIYTVLGAEKWLMMLAESLELFGLLLLSEGSALVLQRLMMPILPIFAVECMPDAGYVSASVGIAYFVVLVMLFLHRRRSVSILQDKHGGTV